MRMKQQLFKPFKGDGRQLDTIRTLPNSMCQSERAGNLDI